MCAWQLASGWTVLDNAPLLRHGASCRHPYHAALGQRSKASDRCVVCVQAPPDIIKAAGTASCRNSSATQQPSQSGVRVERASCLHTLKLCSKGKPLRETRDESGAANADYKTPQPIKKYSGQTLSSATQKKNK